MADYYYSGATKREKRRKRGPLFLRLLDLVMGLVAPLLIVAMVVILIAPYIHPSRTWLFPTLGLAAPIIFTFTLLTTLYWVIRWRWILATPLLMVSLCGVAYTPLFGQ